MAKIPEAKAGLVFRYRYLRIWQYERGEEVGKERPCCILLPLKPGQVITGSTVLNEARSAEVERHVAQADEVMIVLLQSDAPGQGQLGIELTIEDKRYVGLPTNAPSYVVVSETNVDRWPNGDMALVPGRQSSFTYDRPLSGPTLSRVLKAFLRAYEMKKTRVLIRHP